MTDNLKVWNAVCETDPDHTKKVNQRGGFTAIDAHYQIKRATEQFGPVGIGWGYDAGEPIFQQQFVVVPVTLWHGDRANTYGPVFGCAEMFGNRPDADAPKKAGTDALTKLLSQLGFSADVFLGKFDDNKYVAELRHKKHEETQKADPAFAAHIERTVKMIATEPDLESLGAMWADLAHSQRDVAKHPDVIAAKDARKSELISQANMQGAG